MSTRSRKSGVCGPSGFSPIELLVVIAVLGCVLVVGCSPRKEEQVKDTGANRVHQPEDDLNDAQRKSLEDWTSKLKTGNSVADIGRLKDSLKRWDELFMNPASAEMKPVFAILKERVRERIAELELEAKSKLGHSRQPPCA
jgi:hypothetical protein